MRHLTRRALLGAPALVATLGVTRTRAQAPTRFRFNLGWRFEASGAGFLLAMERGYYREEGLDFTMDAGNGSAGAIN